MKKIFALTFAAALASAVNAAECPTGSNGPIVYSTDGSLCIATVYADSLAAKDVSGNEESPFYKRSFTKAEPVTVDSVVYSRATAADKQTVVFPFSVPKDCIANGSVYSLFNIVYDKNAIKWSVRTNAAATIVANTPYVIISANRSIQFKSSKTNSSCSYTIESGDLVNQKIAADANSGLTGTWSLVGTYDRIVFDNNTKSGVYGFSAKEKTIDGTNYAAGSFVKAGDGASVTPFRAYLKYDSKGSLAKAATGVLSSVEEILPPAVEVVIDDENATTSGNVISFDEVETAVGNGTGLFRRAVIKDDADGFLKVDEDVVVDFVEYKRKFVPNSYATIVLPFNVCVDNFGDNCVHMQGFNSYPFGGVKFENDMYTLIFWNEQKTINAHTPILIEVGDATLQPDSTAYLRFRWSAYNEGYTATIYKTPDGGMIASCDTCGAWELRGSYNYKKWNAGDSELGKVYGFAAKTKDVADTAADGTISSHKVSAGEFVKGKAGAYIRPTRAFVYYNASKALAKASAGTIMSIDDLPSSLGIEIRDENGNPMAIGTMNTLTGEIKMDENAWFDMKGRKLNKKPTVKGTYYNKGQKVIIK